ncbi:astacin [Ancylostoma caninum]|uniref:Metalloendopeptidase n=1 Tax=Ancylostoma caninum TaxID=29170 RepID=A0A368GSY0_ANCCA|nr:astacin [Ancylostoma caninum]
MNLWFAGNDGLLVTTLYNACASDVGKVGGWQDLYLGESCEDFGGMAHELGHALGLLHTMSRRDRNDYIFVDLINIKLEYAEEFEKHERTKFYGVGYDYGSVMHYRQRSGFSSLDYLMIPFDSKYKNTFGSKMISFADLKMINSHYNCLEKCKSERPDLKCQHGGYQHPRNCSRCLCPSGYGGTDCSERPSDGCGQELVAKETWQNFTISIQNEDPKKYLDGYKKCNYWIRSPEKTRIKIRLEDIRFRSTAGCTNNGIEIKAKKDQTLTGYRFCYTDEEDLVLSPRFNIAPIIAYSRVNDTGTAVISYRYVESSKDDEEQD